MDTPTKDYYASNAATCAARYDSASVAALHEVLRSLAPAAPRVLEIGGGSGRDSAFLIHLGCHATYTDGCEEMLSEAVKRHPELSTTARCAPFPLPDGHELFRERYDMVLCAAVIMHLDDASLESLAVQLFRLITEKGWLVLSHSRGHRCVDHDRDSSGRLFIERSLATVNSVFSKSGFHPVQVIENLDGLGREHITWMTHVLQRQFD